MGREGHEEIAKEVKDKLKGKKEIKLWF
jgi:hypothetical protein